METREKRNRELQLHYYKVAATHGSETGTRNLIFTYSIEPDRFDMSKAWYWRRELKLLAAQRTSRFNPMPNRIMTCILDTLWPDGQKTDP
jgi:hypothetical protein